MWKHRVFCDVKAYVSCLGYDGILQSVRFSVNQGGTADKDYSSLTKNTFFVRDFFIAKTHYKKIILDRVTIKIIYWRKKP